jgi:2-dehydro-3-deoxygluconokinase
MARGIVAIGECMLELSGQKGDRWRLGYAGDTFNTLWALRALTGGERDADYVSAYGDDPFSTEQIAFLSKNGIGIASSPVIPGARPGLYAITLTGAERSFTYWRADAAARQLASDPVALGRSLENRELIYFSGITLAILTKEARATVLQAVEAAREHGAHVAFDPNYRPRLWPDVRTARAAITHALSVVDIALPTFSDEQALFRDATPDETAARFEKSGVAEIVVKNGDDPATILHYGDRRSSPAESVTPVDTTGAGDSFNGAYLAARLLGDTPADAARRAHQVAAAVIQVRGALAPYETLRAAFAV